MIIYISKKARRTKTKQKKKWIRFRHKVATAFFRPVFPLLSSLLYHVKIDRFFREQGDRNWLILSNHQTDFDQFFIGSAFKKPVYYVAMEDVFSNGFVSKVISWLVAPIPILKASTDARAVMNCIRVAKEGGTIALFPEGNRTYSGRTCYIKPAVAALAKKLGLPIAFFRIEGGYGVKPRWADKTRRGKMKAGVRRVIEPEEYKNMSNDELYELICRELDVDEAKSDCEYRSKKAAESIERVLYVCPDCGLTEFESRNETFSCKRCKKTFRYMPDTHIESENGSSPFRYAADWYDYQESFIRKLDLSPYISEPVYRDTANVSQVIVYDRKKPFMKNAKVSLFGDRLLLELPDRSLTLDYGDVKAMACIGGHKLNIFYKDTIYQLKGDRSFNALKYCNIYYHAKFVTEGHSNGEFQFLGL